MRLKFADSVVMAEKLLAIAGKDRRVHLHGDYWLERHGRNGAKIMRRDWDDNATTQNKLGGWSKTGAERWVWVSKHKTVALAIRDVARLKIYPNVPEDFGLPECGA